IPDECDIRNVNGANDCNSNGLIDTCEGSPDCDQIGIADFYQSGYADCYTSAQADFCDIGQGGSADINNNGIPDECEPDCNTNSLPDICDVGGQPFFVQFNQEQNGFIFPSDLTTSAANQPVPPNATNLTAGDFILTHASPVTDIHVARGYSAANLGGDGS